MDTPKRRHRSSDRPLGRHRTISADAIDGPYLEVLRLLDPYLFFKFVPAPWLHYLSRAKVEYSVFRKQLAYMRELPNSYIGCPDEQLESPNVDHKTLIYELRERGLNQLINRGLVDKRPSQDRDAARRNHSFATHRSHSYKHELIVDAGYYLPLRHLVDHDPALRLIDFAALLNHANVPLATRQSSDPLLIQLKQDQLRFDGTPHVIVRRRADGASIPLGIPGIQVCRANSHEQIEKYIMQAIEFVEGRHYEGHWGFDNCLVPFLFTEEVKKNRAMRFVRKERGKCSYVLFQTIPDYGRLRHYPRPEHYDPNYQYIEREPVHPDTIRIFTNPWQRVGYPDFYLNTFNETGAK